MKFRFVVKCKVKDLKEAIPKAWNETSYTFLKADTSISEAVEYMTKPRALKTPVQRLGFFCCLPPAGSFPYILP